MRSMMKYYRRWSRDTTTDDYCCCCWWWWWWWRWCDVTISIIITQLAYPQYHIPPRQHRYGAGWHLHTQYVQLCCQYMQRYIGVTYPLYVIGLYWPRLSLCFACLLSLPATLIVLRNRTVCDHGMLMGFRGRNSLRTEWSKLNVNLVQRSVMMHL